VAGFSFRAGLGTSTTQFQEKAVYVPNGVVTTSHQLGSGKAYWRIDAKSYWICEAWKPSAKNCPEAFDSWDRRKFQISIFSTINDAINYATEPLDVHGYYQYEARK
jgi:hypothetical protein